MADCPKCGLPVAEGESFCNACGAKLPRIVKQVFCPVCGNTVLEGAARCNLCGTSIGGGATSAAEKIAAQQENALPPSMDVIADMPIITDEMLGLNEKPVRKEDMPSMDSVEMPGMKKPAPKPQNVPPTPQNTAPSPVQLNKPQANSAPVIPEHQPTVNIQKPQGAPPQPQIFAQPPQGGQFGQPNNFAQPPQGGQFGQPNNFAQPPQGGQFGQPNNFAQPPQGGQFAAQPVIPQNGMPTGNMNAKPAKPSKQKGEGLSTLNKVLIALIVVVILALVLVFGPFKDKIFNGGKNAKNVSVVTMLENSEE